MNVLSLFDGISCGQLALRQVGIEIENYFASEIDEKAISVTQYHFPNTIQLGDVRSVTSTNLPSISLLIGGSPCTNLSFAGKNDGFEGQSKLFFEYVRVLEEVNPQYFFLENVKMKKEHSDIITSMLNIEPVFICSSKFSAQKRKRLYWTNIPIPAIDSENSQVLEDILSNEDVRDNYYLNAEQISRGIYKHSAHTHGKSKMGRVAFPTPRNQKSKCLNTVRIKGDRTMTHIEDDKGIRLLSPIEYERLQGLPSGYTSMMKSDTDRFKVIGNGWTIPVIAHIFSGLK